MQITLNGNPMSCQRATTIHTLLETLGYSGKKIAVERNGTIVPKSQHAFVLVEAGDQIEIVLAVGGG
jgi:sulfur carrier protein